MAVKLPLSKEHVNALLLCIEASFDHLETDPDEYRTCAIESGVSESDFDWMCVNHEELVKTIKSLGGRSME